MAQEKFNTELTMESIIMTKKGIGFLIVASLIVLIAGFTLLSALTDTPQAVVFDDAEVPETRPPPATQRSNKNAFQAPAAKAADEVPAEGEQPVSQAVSVETTGEIPIIGQFMRVREVRASEDGVPEGTIRNMKFVFRPGILPHTLFEDNNQVILKYEQLARNMVGSGAKTAFFYYEVVNRDTNGDDRLSREDKFDVAVSRPDGGNYRVLAYNVDEVVEYEDLPVENAIRLVVKMRGEQISRTHSLAGM